MIEHPQPRSPSTEVQVLTATLASLRPLHALGLLFSALCTLLLAFSPLPGPALFAAGLGLAAGCIQTYWHWRAMLDSALLPTLELVGGEAFDRALAALFPRQAQRLNNRDLADRLRGTRRLFCRALQWLAVQLLCTGLALGLHLVHSIV